MPRSYPGDVQTIAWARWMQYRREVIVSTRSAVLAGTVDEVGVDHVRIVKKRVNRKDIMKIRLLPKEGLPY